MKFNKILKSIYYKSLFFFLKNVIKKNNLLKDIHKGEDCYIIGNGYSLKYFDLEKFNNNISLGCNNLFFHKDFGKLNCKYYITTHSSIYSPLWINPYSKKLSFNLFSKIYLEKIINYKNINFFLNLNDFIFTQNLPNIYYLSHFNQNKNKDNLSNPSESFLNISSSLETMISLACFMGFKRTFLVGCDYLLEPAMCGRFYENHENEIIKKFNHEWKKNFLLNAKSKIDISIISINKNFKNKFLNVIDFEEMFDNKINFKQNNKIVNKHDLQNLEKCKMEYRI